MLDSASEPPELPAAGSLRQRVNAALTAEFKEDRSNAARAPSSANEPARELRAGVAPRSPRAPGDIEPDLASLAEQLAADEALERKQRGGGSSPAPWLSPQTALSAIRALAGPHLAGEPSYPKGTRVMARGNVRSEPGRNFITNGDFSRGDLMWSVRSWQGLGDGSVAAYYSVKAGALCTALERAQQVLGGWPWDDRRLSPSSFDLERGKRYRLSLRAWSAGAEPVQLVVKVGHQKPPYTPALVARVPITAEPGLFDIDFVAARHDTSAGFAFVATSSDQPLSQFCIDDVSVRPLDADP